MKPAIYGALKVVQKCLIVSIATDWDDELVLALQKEALRQLNKQNVSRLVIDIAAVDSVDSLFTRYICDTARMASMLDVDMIVAGMSPGVAASIVGLNLDLEGVTCVGRIDDALLGLAESGAY